MAIEMSDVVARNEVIVFTELDDTVVMMDMDEGRYYEFDAIAAKIWTLIETGRPVAELCDALAAVYDVEPEVCRRDVLAFLNETEEMGIVRVNRICAGGAPASRTGGPGSFSADT